MISVCSERVNCMEGILYKGIFSMLINVTDPANENGKVPIEQSPAALPTPDTACKLPLDQQPSDFRRNEETSASSVSDKSCETQSELGISRFTADSGTV